MVKSIVQRLMAGELIQRIKRTFYKPQWHNLRSLQPISKVFGYDRGTPIDRVFIEDFLEKNASTITGKVIEIADERYTKMFGSNLEENDILHISKDCQEATIIGDLTNTATLPEEIYDCFICTETLPFIYDFKKAIYGGWYLLKPGGVMLATVGGISQISRFDMDRWGEYWRFTDLGIQKAFEESFPGGKFEVNCYGNVLVATSFLQGISAEELSHEELFTNDDDYQVIIVIKATKQQTAIN